MSRNHIKPCDRLHVSLRLTSSCIHYRQLHSACRPIPRVIASNEGLHPSCYHTFIDQRHPRERQRIRRTITPITEYCNPHSSYGRSQHTSPLSDTKCDHVKSKIQINIFDLTGNIPLNLKHGRKP